MNNKQKTMANLRMVLEELPKLAEKVPSIREEFDMYTFGCYYGLEKYDLHMCRTRGCLLGNMARLFPVKDEYFNLDKEFDYGLFCKEEFPYISTYSRIMYSNWRFLFGTDWYYFQPTFDQAMKRLEYFIKHEGELPTWDYQKEDFVC